MEPSTEMILKKARDLIQDKGVKDVSLDDLCLACGIGMDELRKHVNDKEDLVDKILEFERVSFNSIFDEYDFDGMNAIDILIIVSLEVNKRFKYVNPAITFDLKEYYPDIYQKNFEDKIEFIFNKIKINLEKGINQGMYRKDFSIELVSRHYIMKLIDFHDPKLYPNGEYSFSMLFDVLFDSFIRSIANQEGIQYYEKRRQLYAAINFSR